MANIGTLLIDLGLNTARLESDAGKATRSVDGFKQKAVKSFGNVSKAIGGATRALGAFGPLAGALSVGALATMVSRTVDAADRFDKLSTRIGAGVTALSEYRRVADLSGVSMETLTMGWQRMTRRVSEAAQGKGEAKDALKELGLEAENLNRLAPEDQFERIADALHGVESDGDRARLAMKLFDSEGVALLQTMKDGAEGIRTMRGEARELGLSMSRDQVDGAVRAKDAMATLQQSITGLTQTLVLAFGPGLADIATFLANGIPQAINFSSEAITKLQIVFAKVVKGITSSLVVVYEALGNLPGQWGDNYEKAAEELKGFATGLETTIDRLNEKLASVGENVEFRSSVPEDMLGLPSPDAAAERIAGVQSLVGGHHEWLRQNATATTNFLIDENKRQALGVEIGNKLIFGVQKKFAKAQIALQAPAAIAAAIKNAGGWPFGAWAGIATFKKYVALLSQTSSASPAGGGIAAGGGGGGAAAPALPGGGNPESPAEAPESRGSAVIHMNIGGVIASDTIADLIDQVRVVARDRDLVLVDVDSRGGLDLIDAAQAG